MPRDPATGGNGRIGQYRIETSTNATTWTIVATGRWADDAATKRATFAPVSARYVRLTGLTEAGNRGPWTSAAEINLLVPASAPPVTTVPGVGRPQPVGPHRVDGHRQRRRDGAGEQRRRQRARRLDRHAVAQRLVGHADAAPPLDHDRHRRRALAGRAAVHAAPGRLRQRQHRRLSGDPQQRRRHVDTAGGQRHVGRRQHDEDGDVRRGVRRPLRAPHRHDRGRQPRPVELGVRDQPAGTRLRRPGVLGRQPRLPARAGGGGAAAQRQGAAVVRLLGHRVRRRRGLHPDRALRPGHRHHDPTHDHQHPARHVLPRRVDPGRRPARGHRRVVVEQDEHLRPAHRHVDERAAAEHRPRLPGPDDVAGRFGVHARRLVERRRRRQVGRGVEPGDQRLALASPA